MDKLNEKAKNIESLYKNIFAIKESLQDAVSVAMETSNLASEFGGEISRVITSQINDYLIPAISVYIENNDTAGAVAPLITFLDSVPLAMTRQEPSAEVIAPSPVDAAGSQTIQAPPTLEGSAVQESTLLALHKQKLAKAKAAAKGEESEETFEDRNKKANMEINKDLVNMHKAKIDKVTEEISAEEIPEFTDEEVMELAEEWGVTPEEVKSALYDQIQMEESTPHKKKTKLKEFSRDIEMYMGKEEFEDWAKYLVDELADFGINVESNDEPGNRVHVKISGNLNSYPDLSGLTRDLETNYGAAIA